MNGEGDNKPSPFFFSISSYIYKWLDNALDYGITEHEFWNMTIAELTRAIESKNRRTKLEAQEKASNDYILADLIGRSIARIYNSSNHYPDISEVYPTLFDSEEIRQAKQEKRNELSALRFKLFAESFNNKFKTKEAQKDNE